MFTLCLVCFGYMLVFVLFLIHIYCILYYPHILLVSVLYSSGGFLVFFIFQSCEHWTLFYSLSYFHFHFHLLFWKQGLEFSITLQLQLQIIIWYNLVLHICHSYTVTQSYVMRNNSRRFWKEWHYIIYYTYIDLKTDIWLLL